MVLGTTLWVVKSSVTKKVDLVKPFKKKGVESDIFVIFPLSTGLLGRSGLSSNSLN